MKKNIIIIIILIILLILGFFLLQNRGSVDVEQEGELLEQEGLVLSDDFLEMQGYELHPPRGYDCVGGFTDGYRYFDGECTPQGREDFLIDIDFGLAMSGINPEEGFLENQIPVRSFDITGGVYGLTVCQEYISDKINLDAEHYICRKEEEGNDVIVMGIGKTFPTDGGAFARWFEARLTVLTEEDYVEDDYIDILASFLNNSVKIDWDFFAGN